MHNFFHKGTTKSVIMISRRIVPRAQLQLVILIRLCGKVARNSVLRENLEATVKPVVYMSWHDTVLRKWRDRKKIMWIKEDSLQLSVELKARMAKVQL